MSVVVAVQISSDSKLSEVGESLDWGRIDRVVIAREGKV
jgi:hypothetical protein